MVIYQQLLLFHPRNEVLMTTAFNFYSIQYDVRGAVALMFVCLSILGCVDSHKVKEDSVKENKKENLLTINLQDNVSREIGVEWNYYITNKEDIVELLNILENLIITAKSDLPPVPGPEGYTLIIDDKKSGKCTTYFAFPEEYRIDENIIDKVQSARILDIFSRKQPAASQGVLFKSN
jgi:hypothetical protein